MKMTSDDQLALFGGKKVIEEPVAPWPQYDQTEEEYLVSALRKSVGCASEGRAVGFTLQFEQEFAAYHKRKFGILCTNATEGLEMALIAGGVAPGDEVLVPSYTFMATASVVVRVGAIPKFIDIDNRTLCSSFKNIQDAVTNKTKAIILVHFGGYLEDLSKILAFANERKILVLEDAAQAHGSRRSGFYAGASHLGAVFSFQRNKNMSAGEGGIILTDDESFQERCREFLWHGTRKGNTSVHHSVGTNMRITEFQSAVLLGQLKKLDAQNKKRMKECDELNQRMDEIPGFISSKTPEMEIHSRHLYSFRMDLDYWKGVSKEKVVQALVAEGVRCGGGYAEPLYRQPAFLKKNFTKQFFAANPNLDESDPRMQFDKLCLEGVEQTCRDVFLVPHFVFLSNYNVSEKMGLALSKVSKNVDQLRSHS